VDVRDNNCALSQGGFYQLFSYDHQYANETGAPKLVFICKRRLITLRNLGRATLALGDHDKQVSIFQPG